MTASEDLKALVGEVMKPLAKASGFKKQGLNWRRRRGATTQVVNVQLSPGRVASEALCYLNVGVALDALHELDGEPVAESPKEYECHFNGRLESLFPDLPADWRLGATTDRSALGVGLRDALTRVVGFLDAVDGPAALLRRVPLDEGAERLLRARLHYVLGDLPAALTDLRLGVAFFADRGMTVEQQIARLKLAGLEASTVRGVTGSSPLLPLAVQAVP